MGPRFKKLNKILATVTATVAILGSLVSMYTQLTSNPNKVSFSERIIINELSKIENKVSLLESEIMFLRYYIMPPRMSAAPESHEEEDKPPVITYSPAPPVREENLVWVFVDENIEIHGDRMFVNEFTPVYLTLPSFPLYLSTTQSGLLTPGEAHTVLEEQSLGILRKTWIQIDLNR